MKKQVLEGVGQRELSHIVLSVNRGNLLDYQIQASLQIKNKISRESINSTSEYFSEI